MSSRHHRSVCRIPFAPSKFWSDTRRSIRAYQATVLPLPRSARSDGSWLTDSCMSRRCSHSWTFACSKPASWAPRSCPSDAVEAQSALAALQRTVPSGNRAKEAAVADSDLILPSCRPTIKEGKVLEVFQLLRFDSSPEAHVRGGQAGPNLSSCYPSAPPSAPALRSQ